ncbi:Protein TALPID3 [Bagarius yarrelli]|uniref:Protein TALPID3 n=1 Tax=Bagarius yarrelli TaxID=175774 RepID=A0A556U954_BAGYA|nr:Protein TALPID3 [Bagarius yarrelli]
MDWNKISLNESTSSSDAAEVLIRSTKAAPNQTSQNKTKDSTSSDYRDVNIYVRRLSDSVYGSCSDGFLEKMLHPVIPPNTHSASYPGQDVIISRYSTHGRGAVVAALKHRSHSAPVNREVKVQLLNAECPQSSEPNPPVVQPNAALSSQDAGTASTVAAITAAAIAATAPLLKAQSDIEVRVAQVASELRRLREDEGRVNIASESKSASGAEGMLQLQEQLNVLTQQRLQHLERIQGQQLELQNCLLGTALNAVTAHATPPSQSTLYTGYSVTQPEPVHRTEFNRLYSVENAARENSGSTVVQAQSKENQSKGGKSLLEMPAPRNVIPKPTQWNRASCSKQMRTNKTAQNKHGNGRLQEPSFNQKSSRPPAQPDRVRQVAIATVHDNQPEHSSEKLVNVWCVAGSIQKMCREWLEHARSDSNKWHVSIRNGEKLRNVVLTSPGQPGGIPSGARGRGGTIKIPTPHARQNVKQA